MNGERLQETWYGDREPGLLLSVLERVYGGVAAHRRSKAVPDPELVNLPIVVVGNITAGGTGKTPLVIRLCELLKGEGVPVAVVSRGYGRRERAPVRVGADTSPAQGGDEPVLIARRCGVPVYVDADREAAARAAFKAGARVVLADDGLQRASLPRIQELCVVDGRRGFGNGRLLPAGPLREPLGRLERVDWLIRNGPAQSDEWLESVPELQHPVVAMDLAPTGFARLEDGRWQDADPPPAGFADGVTAIAGMGNPDRFFDTLRSLGVRVALRRPFPDHHTFVPEDFQGLEGPIVMTEKDAVKCADLAPAAWALRVEARLPADWEEAWLASIRAMLEELDS
ncbi:MAG: tetraacyldisaccharide 4'-kinase [Xanthomonadales bacterium]|nr:tetraacyldisaccharide 4'-kinase [Xanthomonadales bacterium]